MRLLLVYPTHDNCREVEAEYLADGADAACYPPRTLTGTEFVPQNCWNPESDQAEVLGFPVVKTVCPACEHRKNCLTEGYLAQLKSASEAEVALCTHKRAEYSSLSELAAGRRYVSIHENAVDLLRPKTVVSEEDLHQAKLVLDRMLNDPAFLNWFGETMRVDDEGNRWEDKELAIRRERQYEFCHYLVDLLEGLIGSLQGATSTTEWRPLPRRKRPEGIERTLFQATRFAKVKFSDPAWRFLLTAAAGELHTSAILVSERAGTGDRKGTQVISKSVIGVMKNLPPKTTVNWFNDATMTEDRLAMVLDAEVWDETPDGHLPLRKKAVQVLRDVTRRTTDKSFANLMRGVLADRPQFTRVGLITHQPQLKALKLLDTEFGNRIVKSSYFGSGEDRSSNDWYRKCDLIVVAGTPRVPPEAVRMYLVQVGEVGAACRNPDWGDLFWEGKTETGEKVKVRARGYHDADWRGAHRDLVRSQIVQAVGRGRGILETGCEVVVLSNEECGLLISDSELAPLNAASQKVLGAVRELTMENPNKFILGKSIVSTTSRPVKTSQIANSVNLSVVRTRELLRDLEERGLVRKVGERLGWLPVEPEPDSEGAPDEPPPPPES